ncbi:hypothetical protein DIPPA_23639 [Diplonema papillatum]|nr:hypothetical protein DIPPA_23639 [Diplonema papillatum]|eukprot:gene14378-22057_t
MKDDVSAIPLWKWPWSEKHTWAEEDKPMSQPPLSPLTSSRIFRGFSKELAGYTYHPSDPFGSTSNFDLPVLNVTTTDMDRSWKQTPSPEPRFPQQTYTKSFRSTLGSLSSGGKEDPHSPSKATEPVGLEDEDEASFRGLSPQFPSYRTDATDRSGEYRSASSPKTRPKPPKKAENGFREQSPQFPSDASRRTPSHRASRSASSPRTRSKLPAGWVQVTIDLAGEKLGLNVDDRLTVREVYPGTPAERAGLSEYLGWLVFSINGVSTETAEQAHHALNLADSAQIIVKPPPPPPPERNLIYRRYSPENPAYLRWALSNPTPSTLITIIDPLRHVPVHAQTPSPLRRSPIPSSHDSNSRHPSVDPLYQTIG